MATYLARNPRVFASMVAASSTTNSVPIAGWYGFRESVRVFSLCGSFINGCFHSWPPGWVAGEVGCCVGHVSTSLAFAHSLYCVASSYGLLGESLRFVKQAIV